MAKQTVITCDLCKIIIQPTQTYIDAGVYGIELHEECMAILDNGIISLLGIDDIKRVNAGSSRERYYSLAIREYCSDPTQHM